MNYDSDESLFAPPSVDNFIEFFPWAVSQFSILGVNVVIRKLVECELVSTSRHTVKLQKNVRVQDRANTVKSVLKVKSESIMTCDPSIPTITISAYYSRGGFSLTGLKFEQGMIIPRGMVVVLALMIRFHPMLTSITFVKNADKFVIYELSKLVAKSNISEVYLDGCVVREGMFDLLLDENCRLKILSLARCVLTDKFAKLILAKMNFPKPASFTLNMLNLSSNRITDVGAMYVAEMLRFNRSLYYLNLADNFITDEGVNSIFNSLLEFTPTKSESNDIRRLKFEYLKKKQYLINKFIADAALKKDTKETLANAVSDLNLGNRGRKKLSKTVNPMQIQKNPNDNIAEAIRQANETLGTYEYPLNQNITRDGVVYCAGNNTLQSLNLAYNRLSLISLKKILKAMEYQRDLKREPIGLVNLNLEGNSIPIKCSELIEINSLMMQASIPPTSSHPIKNHKSTAKGKLSTRV